VADTRKTRKTRGRRGKGSKRRKRRRGLGREAGDEDEGGRGRGA
jgi:hypothetical protein